MKSATLLQQISHAALAASPALERVGQWMASYPLRVISMRAEEVAQHADASLAAVNRFARSAGFAGFAHLEAALSEELQDTAEPIRKLMPGRRGTPAHPLGLAQHNIRMASQAADLQVIDRAARRLLKCRMLYTLGLGLSATLASVCAHLLLPYVQAVTQVAGEGGTEVGARRLMRITADDALLAVSLPRYSRDTVSLAAYARERGAYVIGVTDRVHPPLSAQADALLLAPAVHDILSSSAVAALAMVEVLAARVMQLNPDSVRLATELSEAVLVHLSVDRAKRPSDGLAFYGTKGEHS